MPLCLYQVATKPTQFIRIRFAAIQKDVAPFDAPTHTAHDKGASVDLLEEMG